MIKIGIFGYGNLARGVEAAIKKNDDLELVAVFTRRDASKVQINTKGVNVYNVKDVLLFKDKIDVMISVCDSRGELSPVLRDRDDRFIAFRRVVRVHEVHIVVFLYIFEQR